MSDDDALAQLAKLARDEEASRDPRWERLARGELSAAEDAELRAQAASDAEVALLYEAYRPLSDVTKEKIARAVLPKPRREAPAPRVIPWRAVGLAAPLAAAAAIALWLARPTPQPVAGTGAAPPDYVLAVSGGDRAQRSVTDGAPLAIELQRDSRLELVLRPSTQASGDVEVRAFLFGAGGARAWSPPMNRSSGGAIRVAGPAGELLGVGSWDVAFAIGRGADVPTDPNVVLGALASDAGARAWQLVTVHVTVRDAP